MSTALMTVLITETSPRSVPRSITVWTSKGLYVREKQK